jgi:hypothetical protein
MTERPPSAFGLDEPSFDLRAVFDGHTRVSDIGGNHGGGAQDELFACDLAVKAALHLDRIGRDDPGDLAFRADHKTPCRDRAIDITQNLDQAGRGHLARDLEVRPQHRGLAVRDRAFDGPVRRAVGSGGGIGLVEHQALHPGAVASTFGPLDATKGAGVKARVPKLAVFPQGGRG